MTSPYYMERGTEREIEGECGDCANISRPFACVDYVGMCENFEAEHFGHVIFVCHPVCEKFERIITKPRNDENTK